MKRSILFLVPVILLLGLYLWLQQSPQTDTTATSRTNDLKPIQAKPEKKFEVIPEEQRDQVKAPIEYTSRFGPLPRSLEGVPIPDALAVDEDGNLIVQSTLRHLFNFFLTTVGEEPLEQVIARIEEYIKNQLQPPAEGQALEIFFRFVEMKKAIIDLQQTLATDFQASEEQINYRYHFEEARAIQRSFLGDEVYEIFFADKEKMDNYMMDLLDIQKDPDLTQEEKQAKLMEIEQQLPEQARLRREENRTYENLNASIKSARESGASEDEIFQMRSEVLGPEKAERFRQADAKQAVWKGRVNEYRVRRDEILNSQYTLSETDKAHAIDALRQELFSGTELIRIETIDRMDQQK